MDKIIKVSLISDQCPIEKVIVYPQLAEVSRIINLSPERSGEHEIRLKKISPFLNRDTIRVTGVGAFSLLEVSSEATESNSTFGHDENGQEKQTHEQLEEKYKSVSKELESVNAAIARINEIEEFTKMFLSTMTTEKKNKEEFAGVLEKIDQGLNYFLDKSSETFEQKTELDEKREQLEKELYLINTKLSGTLRIDTSIFNDIVILIQVNEGISPVNMCVSYQVSHASWSPSYDIRINSEDDSLQLTYFGQVMQTTKEDWNRCKIELSTAQPYVGGSAPQLPIKYVHYYTPIDYLKLTPQMEIKKAKEMSSLRSKMAIEQEYCDDVSEDLSMASTLGIPAEIQQSLVKQSGAGTATFVIDRLANIPSDGKPHKLTITILSLQSTFTYYAVPSKSSHIYLRTKTTNSSDYPLLESKKATVFFDGSFISITSLPMINPGEPFTNSLGIDPSVKLVSSPLKMCAASGKFLSSTKSTSYEYNYTITNNKKVAIRILVEDSLPLSAQEDIKVILEMPVRESVEVVENKEALNEDRVILLNNRPITLLTQSENNITWAMTIEGQSTVSIPFKYIISSPKNKAIILS